MVDTSDSREALLLKDHNLYNQHLIESDESDSSELSLKNEQTPDQYKTWYESLFRHAFKPYWLAGILILSLFTERFWFIVTIYKTQGHGYVLILTISFLNSMLALLNSVIKKKKHKKKLYEYFQLSKTPHVGIWVMGIVSILDLFYVFFLFWSANEIPIWILITFLQLYIPLNMLTRKLFLSQSYYYPHWISGLLILASWGLWYIRLVFFTEVNISKGDSNPLKYIFFLFLSSFLEVISLSIKEWLVRSQPINNEKFNFKVSICQFLLGLAMTPIIIDIYISAKGDGSSGILSETAQYISEGLQWITYFGNIQQNPTFLQYWNFSFVYIIGYAVSTFLYQIVLKALLERRRLLIIRRIFALIIPLTIIAFSLGIPATFQSESSVEIKLPSEFLPPKPTSFNQIHTDIQISSSISNPFSTSAPIPANHILPSVLFPFAACNSNSKFHSP